jgi:SAM-dependent methyltransferase
MDTMVLQLRSRVRDFLRSRAPSLARRLGSFHKTEDRVLLETVILPYFAASSDVGRILFVGCEWYTKPYERPFAAKEYWTLEIDPAKRRFGAGHHIVDSLRNLDRHVPADYFDVIVCNGVFMKTAIETREEAEPSFEACRNALRPGGWFVLGWNDTDELRPYFPSESPALATFLPTEFPPLRAGEHRTNTSYRHTYTFFRKPQTVGG